MPWFFHQDTAGMWRWTRVGAGACTEAQSEQGFVGKMECIADAKLHGFASARTDQCEMNNALQSKGKQ